MVKLPEHYVLDYFYDNDGGCALTALVNHEKFHVVVDPKELKDRSKSGKKIKQEYQRLLRQVQAEASGEEATQQTAPLFVQEDEDEAGSDSDDKDSGIDVRSQSTDSDTSDDDTEHNAGPSKALQRWMLKPLASKFPFKATENKSTKERTVQDWYHCPTHFHHLTISSGKLTAIEDEASEALTQRVDQLIPTINLPKYIQNLKVPSYAASDITVLAEAEGPADLPVHPTLVELDGQQYFLKAVNNAEPGPTKREIQVMKKIEAKGLQNEMRVPLLRGLVHFDGDSDSTKMMGFLMDAIEEPTPLTQMLDSEVPEEKRSKWAKESAKMVDLLHQHGIIWGDAKGDNFMVDAHENLYIIDFGGSYTEGWVDAELQDTEEGDDQAMRRLVNGLNDPENNTLDNEEAETDHDDEEENPKDKEADQSAQHPKSLKRKHPKSAEQEQQDANERAAKQQKKSEEEEAIFDDNHVPFEEGKTVASEAAGEEDTTAAEEAATEEGDVEMQDEEASESTYCYCGGPDSGRMLACDGKQCKKEWFHFECLGIEESPESKKWFCDDCLMVEEWKSLHFNAERF